MILLERCGWLGLAAVACACSSGGAPPAATPSDAGPGMSSDSGTTGPDGGSTKDTSAQCTVTTSDAVGTNYTAPPPSMEPVVDGCAAGLCRVLLTVPGPGPVNPTVLEIQLASLVAGTQTLVMKAALDASPPAILFSDLGSKHNCAGNLCDEFAWGTAGGGTVTISDLTANEFRMTVAGALMEPLGGATDGGMNRGTGATGTFTMNIDCSKIVR